MDFLLLLAESESQIQTILDRLQETYQTALLELGDPVNTIVGVGQPSAILYFASFDSKNIDNCMSLRRNYPGIPLIFLHDLDGRVKDRNKIEPIVDAFLSDVPPPSLMLDIIQTQIDKSNNRSQVAQPPTALPENHENNIAPAMQKVMKIAAKVAPTDATILIMGESGTGKEVTAKWIHNNSRRKNKPFVAINCGAITETILESELFGHKRGSFTGAESDKTGLFEAAHQGTLFLDEIGEMPLNLQVKLLRVLQEKRIRRVGDVEDIAVNVRIIAATNKELKKQVENNKFREDLYYRFNVVPLHLPPLRNRRESLPHLIEKFLYNYSQEHRKIIQGLAPATTSIVMNYEYPGNIRELQNIIEYSVIMCESNIIQPQDLPADIQTGGPMNLLPAPVDSSNFNGVETLDEFIRLKYSVPEPSIDDIEKIMIQERMLRFCENQKQVADSLGISRTSLWRKLKEYKLADKKDNNS